MTGACMRLPATRREVFLFKLLGGVLLLYVGSAIIQGEVVVKSGVWARRIARVQSPLPCWASIAVYLGWPRIDRARD